MSKKLKILSSIKVSASLFFKKYTIRKCDNERRATCGRESKKELSAVTLGSVTVIESLKVVTEMGMMIMSIMVRTRGFSNNEWSRGKVVEETQADLNSSTRR